MCCAKGVRLCSSSIEPLLTFGALLDGHPVPRHIRLHAQSATGTAAVEVERLLTFGALLEGHPVPKHITLIRLLQGWGVLVPVQSRRRGPWRLHILLQGSQAGVHLQQAGQCLALLLQAPVREVATGLWPLMLKNSAQQLKAVDTSQSMAGVHLDVINTELRHQGAPRPLLLTAPSTSLKAPSTSLLHRAGPCISVPGCEVKHLQR